MPYKADPLSEKLDKVAEATGMPQLSKRLNNALPMRFRVIPLMLLAGAIAGLWVQIAVSPMFGYTIVMLAWMFSLSLQHLSPLRHAQRGPLDERERAMFRAGHFTGLIAALGVAVLGCIALGLGSIATMARLGNFWTPTGVDWIALALFLLAVQSNVAVLAASSAMPEPLDDGEDDD